MYVYTCVRVHLLLKLPPEPAGLRSRQQSTTEHFTKCGGGGAWSSTGCTLPELAQPLSSPPSGECFIDLYPMTNAGRSLQSPTKRSESLLTKRDATESQTRPEGAAVAASQVPSPAWGTPWEREERTTGSTLRIPARAAQLRLAGGGARGRPIILKSNQLQSTRRGTAARTQTRGSFLAATAAGRTLHRQGRGTVTSSKGTDQ